MADNVTVGKTGTALDWSALRSRLAGATGRSHWRSLDELAESEEFESFLRAEFPGRAAEWLDLDPLGRRQFLKLMGASLALAGLGACTRQPDERIYPYVKAPEQIVPGEPLFFATAMPLAGYGKGVLVESHMGRPTKVEGNLEHPASLGATDVFAQAAVLTLYDPERSQVVRNVGEIRPWSAFEAAMAKLAPTALERRRLKLRILTETVTSPSLDAQIGEVLTEFPDARWHQYDPVSRENTRRGARMAYGRDAEAQYLFDKAKVVLALDADFLSWGPANLRHVRDFIEGRRVRSTQSSTNRLYVVEPTPTNTGAFADHRLPLAASQVREIGLAVAKQLGLEVRDAVGVEAHAAWIKALVADLQAHRGSSIVVVGEGQPASVHLLGHVINHALGNAESTFVLSEPIEAETVDEAAPLGRLVAEMEAGEVEALLILGGNPVYDAPADLEFAKHLSRVPLRVHLGLYDDETANLCHWHVPEAHFLEAWGDIRAYEGTVTVQQPLILPLYGGKTAIEVLASLTGKPGRSGYDIVREHWRGRYTGDDFEGWWRKVVHDGVVPASGAGFLRATLQPGWQDSVNEAAAEAASAGAYEIVFRPEPSVFDGRFANNAWLQELPRPITRLTWDNAALISPAAAEELGVANQDVVELSLGERRLSAPVWIVPGQARRSVTVHLGYGRSRAGTVGNGAGFDAYVLRTTSAPWFAPGLALAKTGERRALACTQEHFAMEGRELVRASTLENYRRHPDFAHAEVEEQASLYPAHPYEGYAWGMSIDLTSCVGCNACVIACQSENNIPVVGKEDVAHGREMHWIRVDRYFEGGLDDPAIHHQPVLCMHCERAPCEVVCPTNATVHSDEGLNDMVYNRCVGTRYCSNNCPYKVRRFNFRLYSNWRSEPLAMLQNPDVTVRSRGVMEKCTYCVQRINYARVQAKKQDRRIRDGEVVTACQAVCPADAIVFGDINDRESRISRMKANDRNYSLLGELGTQPRTTYLAKIRNPNPEIEPSGENPPDAHGTG